MYFVSLVVIGNYILFNLFLAILLSQFGDEPEDDPDEDSDDEEKIQSEGSPEENFSPQAGSPQLISGLASFTDHLPASNLMNLSKKGMELKEKKKARQEKKQEKLASFHESKKSKKIEVDDGKSCFIFTKDNCIRVFLKNLISHPHYDEFIYSLIAASSIVLAIDEPNISDYKKTVVNILHLIFLGCFIFEMVTKIIVLGFYWGKRAYLRDSWNRLDFFIVIIGITDLLVTQVASDSDIDLRFLRALRALRALRPLRMVSRNEGMKIVVSSVLKAMPVVFNVFLILILFYLIFGILGVIFFKGSFFMCTDPAIDNEDDCLGFFIDPANGVIV